MVAIAIMGLEFWTTTREAAGTNFLKEFIIKFL